MSLLNVKIVNQFMYREVKIKRKKTTNTPHHHHTDVPPHRGDALRPGRRGHPRVAAAADGMMMVGDGERKTDRRRGGRGRRKGGRLIGVGGVVEEGGEGTR